MSGSGSVLARDIGPVRSPVTRGSYDMIPGRMTAVIGEFRLVSCPNKEAAECRRLPHSQKSTNSSTNYMQRGPASVRNVPLSENHPFNPIVGAPKNHEKNASSCKL